MAMLEVLQTMGLDALANHFQIVIPSFSLLGTEVASINMRVLNVDIPEKEITTYEITKRGRKMTRPNGISDQNKQVTFSFRADKYWRCYNALMNWANFVQNNNTMAMASDSGVDGIGGQSEYRHDVEIWSISSLETDAVPNNIWVLKGTYPTSVGGVSFNEEEGDPIQIDVTLDCMDIVYPS